MEPGFGWERLLESTGGDDGVGGRGEDGKDAIALAALLTLVTSYRRIPRRGARCGGRARHALPQEPAPRAGGSPQCR
jgi:hypothetical protein